MKKPIFSLFLFGMLLLSQLSMAQTTRYVKPGATGTAATATSWTTAAGDLQAVVNTASTGDTVYVAAGTYTGGFFMKDGVTVLGGFPATGTPTLANRKPADNLTILDGQNTTRILTQPKDFTIATVWDGFTLQNGKAFAGAGAYLLKNGVLRNCIVTTNTAGVPFLGEYIASQGGVVFNVDATKQTVRVMALTDCNNGAIYRLDNGSASAITTTGMTTITDCAAVAGAMGSGPANTDKLVAQGSKAALATRNYANGFTDWYLPSIAEWQLFVTGCRMDGNKTPLFNNLNTIFPLYGGTTLNNTWYWSSTANTAYAAWGVNFNFGSVGSLSVYGDDRVRAVRAFNLFNTLSESKGGGVYAGAGAQVQGCLVHHNQAPNASGVYLAGAEAQLLNSTVADNTQAAVQTPPAPTWKVGDKYPKIGTAEGVVFWVDATGEHGWVVALNDANNGNTCPWSPNPYVGTQPVMATDQNVAIADTAGYANTATIRAALGIGNTYAAQTVDFANAWYLPAAGQLNKLYAVLPEVNAALTTTGTALTGSYYWSSTAYDASNAWGVYFNYGGVGYNYVFNLNRVRAVRAF